jgi:glycerol kinase
MAANSDDVLHLVANAYYDGSWKYKASDTSSMYRLISGLHTWSNAASGTADTALSWFERMRLDGGKLLIGDTANTGMTVGLTINQGANDDEILALKSSDVNHAMTTLTEQDTYGGFKKASSSGGGLAIRGYTETSLGFLIHSYATTSDSTKSTAGNGTVEIRGLEKSGTSATTFTGSENILAVKNNTTTAFIVGADGDLWMGGETLTVATSKTPSSASDTGTTGMIAWDSSYIYVCTATNTWKRAAISTW